MTMDTDAMSDAISAREASRASYRERIPEGWRTEYDRLSIRMEPHAAAHIIRGRIARRKAEAALPVADAVVAQLRRF